MRQLLLLVVLFFGASHFLYSQSLLEQLGGIRTNFTIVSDSLWLDTDEQFLIERAVKEENIEAIDDGMQSNTETFKSYHLEFIVPKGIVTQRKIGKNREFFKLELLGEEDELLAMLELEPAHVKFTPNWESTTYSAYSVNLQEIPLVILHRTLKVNLVKQVIKRY